MELNGISLACYIHDYLIFLWENKTKICRTNGFVINILMRTLIDIRSPFYRLLIRIWWFSTFADGVAWEETFNVNYIPSVFSFSVFLLKSPIQNERTSSCRRRFRDRRFTVTSFSRYYTHLFSWSISILRRWSSCK